MRSVYEKGPAARGKSASAAGETARLQRRRLWWANDGRVTHFPLAAYGSRCPVCRGTVRAQNPRLYLLLIADRSDVKTTN